MIKRILERLANLWERKYRHHLPPRDETILSVREAMARRDRALRFLSAEISGVRGNKQV